MAKKRAHTSRKPLEADDLTLINGIGPAVENRLNGVGIFTFAQLAALSPADIGATVAGLSGLTTERIIKQDWIGQAHKLATLSTAAEMEQEAAQEFAPQILPPAEPQAEIQEEETPSPRYATFTVDVVLDQDNEALHTEVIHTQSGDQETWTGWQASQLIDFLVQHAGLRLPPVEPAPPLAGEVESPAAIAAAGEPAPMPEPVAESISVLRLLQMETVPAGAHAPCLVLRSGQPFAAHLTLDLSDVALPSADPLNYTAIISARRLCSPRRQIIGEAHGSIVPEDNTTISVESMNLPQGAYRLEANVTLKPTTMESRNPSKLTALMRGHLLQVY